MNDEKRSAIAALKTCRGQIDGIITMIEAERYCIDISTQLLSAEANVKRANKLILSQHISNCVTQALDADNREEKLREITEIISKLLK